MGNVEDKTRTSGALVDQKVYKVAIGVPCAGGIEIPAYDNHCLFRHHLGCLQSKRKYTKDPEQFEFLHSTTNRLLVAYARDRIVEQALKDECDYLLMMDSDMIVPVDIFEALFRHRVDVVAALAFMRNPPYYPVLFQSISGFDGTVGKEFFSNSQIRDYPQNSLMEVDAVGFGAVLIDCNVLRGMKPPWFMSTSPSGEDILWCYRAKREVGARIFADTSVKLGHLGAIKEIQEEDYLDWHRKNPPLRSGLKYEASAIACLCDRQKESMNGVQS